MRIPILLAALAGSGAVVYAASKPRDAVLLSKVESLTLRGDKLTSHRRVPAAPQLKCISHRDVCAKFAVDVMRCENRGAGYDAEDIQWSCSAQLPPEFKLGSTDVICEGYTSPTDPYILKGSCGVEYRLILTAAGEARWPHLGSSPPSSGYPRDQPSMLESAFPYLFWVLFAAVAVFILYNIWNEGNGQPRQRNRGYNRNAGFGGGGGGGGNGWDDPPPPYTPSGGGRRARPKNNDTGSWTDYLYGGGSNSRGSNWQSNLASGAAGAAAGYYAGSRGRNNNHNSNNGGNTVPNYGSTWGGGGSRSGSSGSNSGSGASSSRHESTGFGSTSRR